jgi:hypothetical protein
MADIDKLKAEDALDELEALGDVCLEDLPPGCAGIMIMCRIKDGCYTVASNIDKRQAVPILRDIARTLAAAGENVGSN